MTAKLRLYALSFCLLALFPVLAGAATIEFRTLIDADNNAATGCAAGGMTGVDHIVVTVVKTDATSGAVEKAYRLECSGGSFGAQLDVDTSGWPVGYNANSGGMLVENRISFAALGGGMPSGLRLGFDATIGASTHAEIAAANGAPILYPDPPGRHRSVRSPGGTTRTFHLDGNGSDWGSINPVLNGIAGSGKDAIRMIKAFAYANTTDSFVYFRVDANADSKAPFAEDDSYSRSPGQSLAVAAPGVLANDGDPSGQPITALPVSPAEHGDVTLNADGSFTYVPANPASLQTDSFQYKATNGSKESNVANVTIKVSSVANGAPVAHNDSVSTNEDQPLNAAAPGVLGNDTDPDGDNLTASKLTDPANGTVVVNPDGSFTYTPTPNFSGTDSFTYSVTDGDHTSTATVTITVHSANDAPNIANAAFSVTENAANGTNVGTVDVTDPDSAAHTFSIDAGNTGGAFAINNAGEITVANGAAIDFEAKASYTLTVTVSDGSASASALITITVNDVNESPVAVNDATTINEDGSANIAAAGLIANDTDPENDSLTATKASDPANGTATVAANGAWTYTPNPDFNGTDSFTYRVSDGTNTSNAATVTITVTAVNDMPSFTAGPNVSSLEDTAHSVAWATALSAGPANEAAQTLSFTVDTNDNTALFSVQPSISPAGVLSYTPAANATGTANLTVRISDNGGTANGGVDTSATQPFTITITSVNDMPSFTKGSDVTALENGGAQTFNPWATALSDGDAEAVQNLSFIVQNVADPSLFSTQPTISSTGVLSFTPMAGTDGVTTVTVVIQDDGGTANGGVDTSGPQTFTVNVHKIPAITSANTTTFLVGSPGTFTVTTTGRPKADIAIGGDPLPAGVTFVDNSGAGDGTGTLSGTPAPGTAGVYNITFTASNVHGSSPTQNFTLNIHEPPAITSANAATFTAGQLGSFTVTTTGFPAPSITRGGVTLPANLTFVDNGNGTGTLSGTPAALTGGTYAINFTASNAAGTTAPQSFTLTVNEAPVITSGNNVTFTSGTFGTFTVTTTGFPAPSIARGGASLPAGVSFLDNGNGTGTLSGTPAGGTGGTYAIDFTASNVAGTTAPQAFTLTVNEAPAFTSANNTTFVVGTAGTFTLTASGTPAPSIAHTGGSLPTGVTYDQPTRTLSGTPAAGQGGTYNLTFTASNGVGTDAVQNFTLTVNEAPSITSANNTTFIAGTAGNFVVTTGGFPSPTVVLSGDALPAGVTYDQPTRTLSGAALDGTGGTYNLTFTASNGVGGNAVQNFTLTVNEAPEITSANNAAFEVGSLGTFTVTMTGFPAPSVAQTSGALPGGVTFNAGTATLSGTPNDGTGGTYLLEFTASNGVTPNAVQSFTLTVNEAPTITSANNTTFTVGTAGSFTVVTDGFPNANVALSGDALPAGVTYTAATKTLAGNPNAGTGGTYNLTFTASNGINPDAVQNFTLTIDQAPAITSADNAAFEVGALGTFTVTMTGFPAPSVAHTSGALPGGVTFNAGTATLSGTPNDGTGGTYIIEFTASNGVTPNAVQSFTLTVNEAPTITSANSTSFTVGTAGSFTVVTDGFPNASVALTGDALPAGVTYTAATKTLAGNPDPGTGGTYNLTFTASNGINPDAVQNFTLTINQAPAITSTSSATFQVGTLGTFVLSATGSPAPTITLTNGSLPDGVTYTSATATLSGTPTNGEGGTYNLEFTASNGVAPDAVQNFTLTVNEAPEITSANNTTFTVGALGSFTVVTDGFPDASVALTGDALPSGVTYTAATKTLAGTPDTGSGGTYNLVFTASNGITPDAVQNFTLTVEEPPVFTSADNTTFTVGALGTFVLAANGTPAPSIALTSGTLPDGVTYTAATKTLEGTPTNGEGGTYNLEFTASNGTLPDAVQNFTLTVNEAPAFTSANNTTFTVGAVGSFTVVTDGFPDATVTLTNGTLPGGVTFTSATKTLSGTPDDGVGGTYNLEFTASNGVNPDAVQNFTLTINEAPEITSANTDTFEVLVSDSFVVTTTGFPAVSVAHTNGALPSGVTFTPATSTLGGTPAAGQGGAYVLEFTATNGVAPNAVQSFTLNVNQPPAITSANSTTFTVGSLGTFSVTTTGFPQPDVAISGDALPSGVTYDQPTRTLSGTPNTGTGGTYNLVFTASNGVGTNAVQNFTLTISDPPVFTSANNTTFAVGTAGNFVLAATGTPSPSIALTNGTLPTGVTYTAATKTLAGTPADGQGGVYALEFTATNGTAPDAVQNFTLTVNEAPEITSANNDTFTVGTADSFTVTFTGHPTATVTLTGDALPSGLSYDQPTATLSGTPGGGSTGTYNLIFTASNGVNPDAVQNFTLSVICPTITVTPAAGALTAGTYNVVLSPTVTFTGSGISGAYTYSVTAGALPGGLNLDANSGVLSGTPNAVGAFSFTIRATHTATSCFGENAYTMDIKPDAQPDNYGVTAGTEAVGNTQVIAGGFAAPGTPHVSFAGTIVANDASSGPITITTVTDAATTLDGRITINAAGQFIYTPKVNVVGTDTFTYTITSNGITNTAVITIKTQDLIWYVDSSFGGVANGQSQAPFTTVNAAGTASAAGSTIYVHDGAAPGALSMDANQTLFGQGQTFTLRGLSIAATTNPTLSSTVTVGNNSTIRGVTINNVSGADVTGTGAIGTLSIQNNTLSGHTGLSFNALTNGVISVASTPISVNVAGGTAVTLTGSAITSLAFTGSPVTATTGSPIVLTGNTAGAVTFDSASSLNVTAGAGASAINISTNSGTFGVAFNGSVTAGAAAGTTRAITINSNTATGGTSFGNTVAVTTSGVEALRISGNSSAHAVNFTGASKSFTTTSGNAVVITANFNTTAGVVGFSNGNTDITTITSGTALTIDKGAATNAGVVSFSGSGNDIGAAGSAMVISDLATGSGFFFNSTASAGGTNNVSITNPGGAGFTLGTGNLQNASGASIAIASGGNMTLTSSNNVSAGGRPADIAGLTSGASLTFSGTMASNTNGFNIHDNTAGSITFSGTSKSLSVGTGAGLTMSANGTTAVTFSNGGFAVTRSTGFGISGSGGGTLVITRNAGTANTIGSGSNNAGINLNGVTIGAGGLVFQSIAQNGGASGIVLNNTGSTAGLTVAGNGGTCSSAASCTGGAIQNTSADAVSLTSTTSPSFTRMAIQNAAGSGIEGTGVVNFTFQNGFIDSVGTGGGANESNIAFKTSAGGLDENNVSGIVTIASNTLTNSRHHGINILNYRGTISDLQITGNTLTSSAVVANSLGNAILVDINGDDAGAGNITKGSISSNDINNFPSGAGIRVDGGNATFGGPDADIGTPGNATNILNVNSNLISGDATNKMATQAINVTISGEGDGNISISDNGTVANPITNVNGVPIACSGTGRVTLTCTVHNNTIVANNVLLSAGISGGGGQQFSAADAPDVTLTITNNNVSAVSGVGIHLVAQEGNASLSAKIQNNIVAASVSAGNRPGIQVNSGALANTGSNSVCLNISGNTSAGAGVFGGIGLRKQGTAPATNVFGVNGMAATSSPGVEAYVNGLNPAGGGTTLMSATSGFTNCSLP